MIKVSFTYEIYTQESTAAGDAEERGYLEQDIEMGFKEVVTLIKEENYSNPCCYPCKGMCKTIMKGDPIDVDEIYPNSGYEEDAKAYMYIHIDTDPKTLRRILLAAGLCTLIDTIRVRLERIYLTLA